MARASIRPVPSALAMTTVPSAAPAAGRGRRSSRGIELQRIGEIGIETAQQHVARFGPERADIRAAVPDGEVVALDQERPR